MKNDVTDEQFLATFEKLPTTQKMEAFWDLVTALSADLSRFNDPVLTRETDILDAICSNIDSRLEEIKAIYGGVE